MAFCVFDTVFAQTYYNNCLQIGKPNFAFTKQLLCLSDLKSKEVVP